MKTTLLILLSFLAIACKGQQPDINCYSQQRWDSLLSVNETIETQNNQLLIYQNILQLQIVNLQSALESQVYPTDTLLFTQDSIAFKVDNDSIVISFAKIGNQINYMVADKADRINLWYNQGKWEVWFMDGTASWQHFNGVIR